jgi:hypothetical protein
MAWDHAETASFLDAVKQGEGQVTPGTPLGDFLISVAKMPEYTHFLEIGTWSGMGSTRCFHRGFLERTSPFVFTSLECNKDKCEMAAMRYIEDSRIQILNSTVIPAESIPPLTTLQEMFDDLVEHWHSIDMENMASCSVLSERNFHVVFLDGGEYTTYFEYKELISTCHTLSMIICDDTQVNKCKKVRSELLANPDWKLLIDEPKDRNGWCVFVKTI